MLFIVSTPIGNLKDITFRAVEILKSVDIIAAEDTRHTKILTHHYNIVTPLTSYYEHNETKKARYLVGLMQEGKSVALVSDAGTPGISDPGYRLIRLARDEGIAIDVIPGPTAVIAALSLSGLPSDRFVFEGFLPVKSAARRKRLESLREESRTIVAYESPHRLLKALKDFEEVLSDPEIFCARELTKKFQEGRHEKASAMRRHFEEHKPRGEFVLVWKSE